MKDDIEWYLNLKGLGYKLKNGELAVDQCPINGCGPGHFYINAEKEIFYCHKCGEKGHLLSLKKKLGDLPSISHISQYSKFSKPKKAIDHSIIEKYHNDLLGNPSALAYLTEERGFTLETVKKFKLGWDSQYITIPYFKDGVCVGIKKRSIKTKDYIREAGCESTLFNIDNAKNYQSSVIVAEGEFDAMAYDQMGFPNVISIPNGAESFPDELTEDLEQFNEVYTSYDGDDAGRRGAEKIANKLGRYRCLNVLLPLKDANDCLKAGFVNQEISEILAKAKPFQSNIIKPPEAYYDEIRAFHEGYSINKAILTGWGPLDDLWGGVRPNELTVLTGETGSGKTTWAVNHGYRLSLKGHPVLIASFEMKPLTIMRKMVSMKMGRPLQELKKSELESALQDISTLPLYFIDVYGEIGIKELKDAIYYSKRRFGIELVILDHLHFFLRYTGDYERQAIDQALRDIKSWAMDLDIHVLLIVHPTKLTYDNKVVHLNDLKGSSGLKQIPDNVISIWRPRGDQQSNEIILHILKVRDDSGDEGKVILTFDKRSQSYSDSRPGDVPPVEGRRSPELPSPRPRSFSGKDLASGYDQ